MTEKYHCTPLEYDKQPSSVIQLHCQFLSLEVEKDKLEALRQRQKEKISNKK